MATVHPSRMGLVPGATASLRNEDKFGGFDRDQDRSREKERRRKHDRDRDRDSGYRRDYPRRDRDDSHDHERDRDRGRRYEKEDQRRERSPGRERERDEDRRERERERPRRASPDYSSYRREEPPRLNDSNANVHVNANNDGGHSGDVKVAPWREPENMYASRGRGRPPAGGDDFFASRRAERASKEVNIWPPSPKEPSRDPADMKKKRSSKRRRSTSPSSDDDSEEERERRRKERKRKEKKEREERKHRRKHRREKSYDDDSEDDRKHRGRHSKSYRSDESDEEDERRRSRSHRRSRSEKRCERSRHKSRHSSSHAETPPWSHRDEEEEDDEWVEKPADSFVARAEHTGKSPHMESVPKEERQKHQQRQQQQHTMENASASDSEEEVGPKPVAAPVTKGKKVDERQYGGALLRGEGSAMAAFLQDGDTQARIPRRGEIGLAPDEIAQFESVGYVMSGSRHRRMNAVRMRKENQVISAEEKRGILKLQKEERERREAILRDEFRELVEEKLKGTAVSGTSKNGREE